ncbi:MAG: TonB-dependent receptor domain-containing protein, partial [Thermoanaerobaculia bacterium]
EVSSSQTFIGFASGRYVFFSLDAFLAGARSATDAGLYLQLVPVQGNTVNSVGTQTITQKEPAIFIQDQWQPTPNLTLEFGVRWEEQDQPGPRTPPNEVFFAPFIGQTVTNEFGTFEFPSDGTIPDDDSIQPRFALAWTPDAKSVVRASYGRYMARLPALMLASSRSTNGSIGGNVRPDQVPGLPPPTWPNIIPGSFTSGQQTLFRPEIFIFDKNFELPKTTSISLSYEREVRPNWAVLVKGNYAETEHLFRMFNQNTPFFGCPWSTGIDGDNGVACNSASGAEALHTVESTARSEYTGITLGINKRYSNNYQFQVYYTNSEDMSDDDNERDPFTYRYARADSLGQEWSYSDRHSRHRVNAWLSWQAPKGIDVNVRYSYRSAQPLSVDASGNPIGFLEDRIEANQPFSGYCFFLKAPECFDAPVTRRNLGKKDNKLNVWDLRVSKDFQVGNFTIQPAIDIFNVFDEANFLRPEVGGLDFNFDGTLRTGAGDPQEIQLGVRLFW